MNHRVDHEPPSVEGLSLADGSAYRVVPEDRPASVVIAHLARVMRLSAPGGPAQQILVSAEPPPAVTPGTAPRAERATIDRIVQVEGDHSVLVYQMMRVSLALLHGIQDRGGLLLHGALVEREGAGVILAGPGGRGKTTASSRIAPPWRGLSDDATLVVPDEAGGAWAHPWPTWTRLMKRGPHDASWDVQRALALRGIFFLVQAQGERVEPVGSAQAACMLVESADQVMSWTSRELPEEARSARGLQRFDNICALARAVSCYQLHLSLEGPFWQEIERALTMEGPLEKRHGSGS